MHNHILTYQPVMEEKDTGESEPVDLQCAEQTDLVSLIISGEEEATQEEGDLGQCSLGEVDGIANGYDESQSSMATPAGPPQTSYWSISEGPDQPLLLSPAPGPSAKAQVQMASRQGHSRIPGRDHRRYYHEYWRSEYLMDFDPQRQGMICMVCGSSLATLKLSTIKRHIRQKHPDSLLWSAADKEVIRSGWESHLSLEGSQKPYSTTYGTMDAADLSGGPSEGGPEEPLDRPAAQPSTTTIPGPISPQQQQPQPLSPSPRAGVSIEDPHPASEEEVEEEETMMMMMGEEVKAETGKEGSTDAAEPSKQILERYLNDSLHAWFRLAFLMKYEVAAGRLLCMVCGGQPRSLHLDHIKSHVLERHPDSLVYSAEEKHCILQAWAQTHPEEADEFIQSERETKDTEAKLFPQDAEALQANADYGLPEGDGALPQDSGLIGEDGVGGGGGGGSMGTPNLGARGAPGRLPRRRRLRDGEPWRLRLDYLVAYGPQGRGTYCMVCSQVLSETKVSSFRRHIQECHPETSGLSRQDREAMAAAWTKDYHGDSAHIKEELNTGDLVSPMATDGTAGGWAPSKTVKKEEGVVGKSNGKPREGSGSTAACATTSSRISHYPGKDQRRNYQVRWRMEFLMDYDCRRHGLICMVCGSTLATLKVSTIKRHIQQVHPHSLVYSAAERQQALLSYGQTALHFVHSDDCFSTQDHAGT